MAYGVPDEIERLGSELRTNVRELPVGDGVEVGDVACVGVCRAVKREVAAKFPQMLGVSVVKHLLVAKRHGVVDSVCPLVAESPRCDVGPGLLALIEMDNAVERDAPERELGEAVGLDCGAAGCVEADLDGLPVEGPEVEADKLEVEGEVHHVVGALCPKGCVVSGIDGFQTDGVDGGSRRVEDADGEFRLGSCGAYGKGYFAPALDLENPAVVGVDVVEIGGACAAHGVGEVRVAQTQERRGVEGEGDEPVQCGYCAGVAVGVGGGAGGADKAGRPDVADRRTVIDRLRLR